MGRVASSAGVRLRPGGPGPAPPSAPEVPALTCSMSSHSSRPTKMSSRGSRWRVPLLLTRNQEVTLILALGRPGRPAGEGAVRAATPPPRPSPGPAPWGSTPSPPHPCSTFRKHWAPAAPGHPSFPVCLSHSGPPRLRCLGPPVATVTVLPRPPGQGGGSSHGLQRPLQCPGGKRGFGARGPGGTGRGGPEG